VCVRRERWERVTEREEFVGRFKVASRLPQYLEGEWSVGAVRRLLFPKKDWGWSCRRDLDGINSLYNGYVDRRGRTRPVWRLLTGARHR
jgi:hypothetical protein